MQEAVLFGKHWKVLERAYACVYTHCMLGISLAKLKDSIEEPTKNKAQLDRDSMKEKLRVMEATLRRSIIHEFIQNPRSKM